MESHFPSLYPTVPTDAGPTNDKCTAQKDNCLPKADSGLKRFPFNNFTYFLTLFSKCFSSFDHSTCALSVSRQYLALDEIYHPF